jgi:hypothetical protein
MSADDTHAGGRLEDTPRIAERVHGVRVSAVAWTPAEDMEEPRWLECGRGLGRASNGTSWWIGDWLRYGNARFGERYSRAARVTGYDIQTLMNYAYVATHVRIPERRPDLSWSHHAELASLDVRSREAWLERCARERLSVKDLRAMLRGSRVVPEDAQESARVARPEICALCGRPLPRARELGAANALNSGRPAELAAPVHKTDS